MKRILNLLLLLVIFISCKNQSHIPNKTTFTRVREEAGQQVIEASPKLAPLVLSNIQTQVLSQNKVLITWSTNIKTLGEVDLKLLNEEGQIENTISGLSEEYPPVNFYKEHSLLLSKGPRVDLKPGRKYEVVVRVTSKDGQTKSLPGPDFNLRDELGESLFVQNGTNEILIYPFDVDNKDLEPTVVLKNPGEHRLINATYDSRRDILYLTTNDVNSILVFTNIKNPSIGSETRMIKGSMTGLNKPSGLFIDQSKNILYVANQGANSVTAFHKASLIQGNVRPNRTIVGNLSWVKGPTAISIDTERDVMYVSCHAFTGDALLTFYPASKVDGNEQPVGTMFGEITKIEKPVDITFDAQTKQLYILKDNGSIVVFHDQTGGEYKVDSPRRLYGMKAPDRIIKGNDWWLEFSPNKYGGLSFDKKNNRLYISGKTIDNNKKNVVVVENAREANGNTPPNFRLNSGDGITSAKGIEIDVSTQKLFVINYDQKERSLITTFDVGQISNGDYLVVGNNTQVSAFTSPLKGITFDEINKKLIALSGNILSFSKETIQNAWNYFNADTIVVKDSDDGIYENFKDLIDIEYDSIKDSLYALNQKENTIDVFDNYNSTGGQLVSRSADRRIYPDIHGHIIESFTVDNNKDKLIVLAKPIFGSDRNLKLLIFKGANIIHGNVKANKTYVISEALEKENNSYRRIGASIFKVKSDLSEKQIFVSHENKIEIYDLSREKEVNKVLILEPAKVLSGALSKIGVPTSMYLYKPEKKKYGRYLLVTNLGDNTGVLGFNERVLDPETNNVSPIFNLGRGSSRIHNPTSVMVGNINLSE